METFLIVVLVLAVFGVLFRRAIVTFALLLLAAVLIATNKDNFDTDFSELVVVKYKSKNSDTDYSE